MHVVAWRGMRRKWATTRRDGWMDGLWMDRLYMHIYMNVMQLSKCTTLRLRWMRVGLGRPSYLSGRMLGRLSERECRASEWIHASMHMNLPLHRSLILTQSTTGYIHSRTFSFAAFLHLFFFFLSLPNPNPRKIKQCIHPWCINGDRVELWEPAPHRDQSKVLLERIFLENYSNNQDRGGDQINNGVPDGGGGRPWDHPGRWDRPPDWHR